MRSSVVINLAVQDVLAEMAEDEDALELLGDVFKGGVNEVIDSTVRIVWAGDYEPPYDSITLEAAVDMAHVTISVDGCNNLAMGLSRMGEADETNENRQMISDATHYVVSRTVEQIYYALKGIPAKLSQTSVSAYANHTNPILSWRFEDA